MRHIREFCIIAVVLLCLFVIFGCAPTEPHWKKTCVKSHSRTDLVYWPGTKVGGYGVTPGGSGINVGGGIHMVTKQVCDKYDSTWVVPEPDCKRSYTNSRGQTICLER